MEAPCSRQQERSYKLWMERRKHTTLHKGGSHIIRCIKTKQNKTVGLQCEKHEEISEKKEKSFKSYPKLDVCMSAQSSPTLCNPMQCRPPGSFLHGIFQASKFVWVTIF